LENESSLTLKGILMKSHLSVFLVVFVLIVFGCTVHVEEEDDWGYSDNPPPVPAAEYPQVESNFDARIEAANAITSIITRDQALSSIANDASRQLDIADTLRAVSRITSITTKDATAERCVTSFINENKIEDAKRIANQITSITTRDRVLTRIAQGPGRNL
jgi:hypothetical protein